MVMSTVGEVHARERVADRIRPEEEPGVRVDVDTDDDEREDDERLWDDLDDLEGESLHRVERVAQQQLIPGEHEDREGRPEQRPHARDIQRGEDQRQTDHRADHLQRGDVVPVAGELIRVARALAHVERGKPEIGERAHQADVRHRGLHLAEPRGVEVVADDDHSDQRDDPRDHAHHENEHRVAQCPHPETARHVRRRRARRRGFVLQGAHSIRAFARVPLANPGRYTAKPCLTSPPSDRAPTPSSARTAAR